MVSLQYYCEGQGSTEVVRLLIEITSRYNIQHDIIDLSNNGVYDEEKEKRVYEAKFKPRAKILKKKTGMSITKLRSRKARHYFVSIPGTISVIRNGNVEWYAIGEEEITKFLNMLLIKGHALLEELWK
jgi:hypothetical protein